MARISVSEAQGWAEATKLPVASLDANLLGQIETEVLARLSTSYDTSTWIDAASTPSLVRVVIAKLYVCYYIRRSYSEEPGTDNDYAIKLEQNAEILISGIVDGTIELPGSTSDAGLPTFYPTDESSSLEPTYDNPSLGPALFSMGKAF